MKKKISRIWGVGLVLVLATSLLLGAAPVSAGTLSWSDYDIPDDTGKVVIRGADINDFAVAGDGETVYAACPTSEALKVVVTEVVSANTTANITYIDQDGNTGNIGTVAVGTDDAVGAELDVTLATGDTGVRNVTAVVDTVGSLTLGKFDIVSVTSVLTFGDYTANVTTFSDAGKILDSIYKSSNAGQTWTTISNPAGCNTTVDLIAVAPDDPDLMGIVADGTEVYVTTNGGTTWKTALATVREGTAESAATINDIAISSALSGTNYVAVCGTEK
jgi:hypothetical protein